MEITLRKANAMQTAIIESLKKIQISFEIELNEFEDIATVITLANDKLVSANTKQGDLLTALYTIRGLVGQANSVSGISLELAKAACIDKRLIQLDRIANAPVMCDLAVLTGKMNKIKNRASDDRFGRDTVTTGIVSSEQVAAIAISINELKKQKIAINDKVLSLNINTMITIPADVIAVLQSEDMI